MLKLNPGYDGPLFLTRNTTHPEPKEHSPFYGGSSKRPIDLASDPLPLSASLAERLDIWAAAPGGILDDDVTPETYRKWNDEECAAIDHQKNIYELQAGQDVWDALTRDSVLKLRMGLIKYMRKYIGSKVLRDATKLQGRGIVMLAGNGDTLKRVVWTLKMLRSYNCKLPVRVVSITGDTVGGRRARTDRSTASQRSYLRRTTPSTASSAR